MNAFVERFETRRLRYIVVTLSISWLLVGAGCKNEPPSNIAAIKSQEQQSNFSKNEQGSTLRAAEQGLSRAQSPCHITELPSWAGTEGYAIDLLTDLYWAEHNQLPTSAIDFASQLPFSGLLGGFDLRVADQPDGGKALLAERTIDPSHPISRMYVGKDCTPEGLDGYIPPMGVHGGMERYLVMDDIHDSRLLTERMNIHFRSLCGLLGETEGGFTTAGGYRFRSAPASESIETAKIGILVEIIGTASHYSSMFAPDQLAPASLEELAAEFGGLSPSGWRNPYTEQPMKAVPLSSPVAGDYSDLSSADGVLIAFHYLDRDGQVSSRLAGYTGKHQRGFLKANFPTPQAPVTLE